VDAEGLGADLGVDLLAGRHPAGVVMVVVEAIRAS
jgi:hypothetical protein